MQPALGDRYTKAQVDAAIAAASPKLLTVTIPAGGAPSTTSMTYAPIPDTTLDVVVPPGGSWRALITLSGETQCVQSPSASVFCFVQAVVDPGAAVTCTDPLPLGCASPGKVVFDSVQHGPNSTDDSSWGSHSQEWTHVLTPGPHTIEMQWRVDETAAEFSLDARTLSVQLYPA